MNKLQLLFAGIIISFSASAQTGWTPEVMIKFKRVGGVDASPDGRLIAYTISTPIVDGEKSEFVSQIWVTSSDGKMNMSSSPREKSHA